ncbi:MAG: hypothetical protein FJX64_01280 [Alphaproteobacteria bacterium]|nr:hypothetical protein [Alphaproteobacteria bacterium]
MSDRQADSTTVDLPCPPTIGLIAALAIPAFLEAAVWTTTETPTLLRVVLGVAVLAFGFSIIVAALRAFQECAADPNPHAPAPCVLTGGVYRLSRNPIYVGFLALPLGLALWWSSAWLLVAIAPLW